MRLYVILPDLDPALVRRPSVCPHCGCESDRLERHQRVAKPVQDTKDRTVPAQRYCCPDCGRTFRIYPQGVGHAATSQRLKDLAVALYLLGLSYGAISTALEALGLYISKTRVHAAVQAATGGDPSWRRCALFTRVRRAEGGGDRLLVCCSGRRLALRVAANDPAGLVLAADGRSSEEAEMLKGLPEKIARVSYARLVLTGVAEDDRGTWLLPPPAGGRQGTALNARNSTI